MPRYFIELAYIGTNYSGFQVQLNANTIQSEVEKALLIITHQKFELTGSSRTDAGVHALQNFFHFDTEASFNTNYAYNLNAILPPDISINRIFQVSDDSHSRFSAITREYAYHIYQSKNPFLYDRAYFFPYNLNIEALHEAASILKEYRDFTTFSKKHTQVNNFNCDILESYWNFDNGHLVYHVKGNRFLRGMVRGLVGTMLRVGKGSITIEQFRKIIEAKDCSKADFSAPGRGLFLVQVS